MSALLNLPALRASLLPLAAAVVALSLSPAHAALRHEYLFNSGNGIDVIDSVGTANGTIAGGATVDTSLSRLTLGGVDGYADLPGATIAINTYTEITMEGWFRQNPANTNQFTALGMFGRTSVGDNGESAGLGYDYLMLQPTRGPAGEGSRGAIAARITEVVDEVETVINTGTFDGERGVTDTAGDLSDGLLNHVAVTVNATELAYYVNGVQIGIAPLDGDEDGTPDFTLADLSNESAYLGRSLYNDPFFNGSIYEFRIHDNAFTDVEVGAAFTTGCLDSCGSTYLEVNRDTGVATLVNDIADRRITYVEMASTAGALDTVGWTPISGNSDSNGDGSIDDNDPWVIESQESILLAEAEPFDGGGAADDGALLPIAPTTIDFGAAWQKSRFEDMTASIRYLDENFEEVTEVLAVLYVGNGDQGFSRSDFDADGDLDADDYGVLLSNHLLAIDAESTQYEAWLLGDVDGDLDNDFNDFRLFKNDYIAANGAAAFAALAAIPEPASAMLLLAGVAFCHVRRR